MSNINILHLSDIHFKQKEDQPFREDVKDKMMAALRQHLEKHPLEPDFVAVTGDIAFSGREYEEAGAFFKDLKAILPGKTEFLAVPGNHDVDRRKISKFFSLHTIVRNNKTDAFLTDSGEMTTHIAPKFSTFREFIDRLNPALYENQEDYFWVKDFNDKNVSVLGLNSCWACEDDEDRNNITLGYPQVMAALKKAKSPNRVVLMHHPPVYWLNEIDFNRYSGEIFHQCGLILHGHTHADNALVFKNPADSCLCLGANASYTEDKQDGFIGFQWIEVEFRDKGVGVKVWPYRLDKRGRLRFVPDVNRWEDQEGPFFELDTFRHDSNKKRKEKKEKKTKSGLPLEIPRDYKEWVRHFQSTMDIELLAKKGEVITVSLPEVYIPIDTRNPFYKPEEDGHKKSPADILLLEPGDEPGAEPAGKAPASIDIEELAGLETCLLLQGEAGMGKTTLVKHLAYTMTTDTCPANLQGCLPVLVFLKDFWLYYREELQKKDRVLVFEDLLGLYLEKTKCHLACETVLDWLAQGKAVFLIDGLDEVPGDLRPDLVEMIARFWYEHKENRFLLTGRAHGITGAAKARFGENLHHILPLDDRKTGDFIRKWFRAVSGPAAGLGERTAAGLLSDIRQQQHISVFTQNPLLLTAVCILYQDGKRIPDQRADLYNRIIANLISRRFHDPAQPGKETEVLEFLMTLAFTSQEKNRKTMEIDDFMGVLKTTFAKKAGEPDTHYQRRILKLYREIEPGCGLFNRLSSGAMEFTHLTFQEFLAAKYMVYMDIDWEPFLEKGWWEETLLLYTGLIGIDRKKKCNEIAARIFSLGGKEKKSHRLTMLAARALCDFQPTIREETVVAAARDRLYRLIEGDAGLAERSRAGELVGSLGDSRIKEDNLVMVPAGEFIRGSDEMREEEKPVRRIYLDAFMIGVYPVTNLEFKRFVEDNGYEREELWPPGGWQRRRQENITEPLFWYERTYNGPNFPVVGISWYEAAAYARWLSKVTGKPYRLPTEAEWEKAARGTDGKTYPWGNTFAKNLCNSGESGLGRTSPVGLFSGGKSEYGGFDMAGNVWEWCDDWYDENYYKNSPAKNPQGPKTGSNRVLRGGGWGNNAWNCRAAYRILYHPALRSAAVGFRLARSF